MDRFSNTAQLIKMNITECNKCNNFRALNKIVTLPNPFTMKTVSITAQVRPLSYNRLYRINK